MLAYLEELCTALLAHDSVAIHRLLAHPLAHSLPRQVREEALAISRAHPTSLRAPIQTLRFFHQSLQLGEDDPDPSASNGKPSDGDVDAQKAESPTVDTPATPAATLRDVLLDARPREQIEIPFDYIHARPVAA
jgi:hypothetical protein